MQVVTALEPGLRVMRVGGTSRFTVPAALGSASRHGPLPGNTTLIWKVGHCLRMIGFASMRTGAAAGQAAVGALDHQRAQETEGDAARIARPWPADPRLGRAQAVTTVTTANAAFMERVAMSVVVGRSRMLRRAVARSFSLTT